MEVTKYKLTNVCDFQGGSQPPKKEWSKNKKNGFIRMLQIRDFTQREKNNIEYVKESNRLKKCKTDDVLIGRYGASIGKILTGLEGAYNVAIMKAIPNEKLLNKQYLLALLRGPIFQNFIQNIGGRAAQAGFNKEDLSKFNLSLPSLDNQKRIAQVLSNCENLIQKRKESITLLDELLKSTFLEMFGDYNTNPYGFKKFTISDVSTEIKDGPHVSPKYSDVGIPILSTRNVRPGRLVLDQMKYVSDEEYRNLTKRFKPKVGDILLTKGGTTGFAKVVNFNWKFCVWVHLAVIRPNELITPIYLEHFFNCDFGYFQSQKYTRGIANKDLGLKRIAKIKLLLPPLELQNKFSVIVEKVESIKQNYQTHLQELECLYGSIGQKAFKGELDLSKAELDSVNYPDLINTSPYSLKDITEVKEKQDNSINKLTDLIEIDKVLDEIVKNDLKKELFSIDKILEILKRKNINIEVDLIKDYLKNSMNHNRIGQEFSGSTKQVMFKFKK